MTISFSSRCYIAHSQVSTRLAGDKGAVLFHAGTGRERFINGTGLQVWELLSKPRSPDEITNYLSKSFDDVPADRVGNDVGVFLENMEAQGFVLAGQALPHEEHPLVAEFPDVSDSPKSLDISLTGRCNLHCAYCFYHDEMESRPDLPAGHWISFFEELGRLAVQDLCLSGGEVFVRPDLWDLIDGVIDNRMRYSINTNGTLVTEKILAAFEQGKRRRRLTSIQVSIDGSCAEVHDKSRGKGSFNKAVRGVRLLKEAGFPVTVRVTVNRHNVEDLDNIASLLLDDIGIRSFGTNDAMPMGAGCDNQKSIILTPAQQVTAMKTLARLSEKYDGRIMATAGPLAKWKSYEEMEHARATGEKATRWKMGYLTSCGCVFNKLAVHHDGVITPCNMLAKLNMGQINVDSLKDIWKNHYFLKDLKERRKIPMTDVPGCQDCSWAPFCNGGCPGLAYEMTGDFNRANPHDCYRRFIEATGFRRLEESIDEIKPVDGFVR